MKKLYIFLLTIITLSSVSFAHPHVFIDLSIETESSDSKEIQLLLKWKIDEMFSFNLINDFDEDGDIVLNADEILNMENFLSKNLSKDDYYTFINLDDKKLECSPLFTIGISENNLVFNLRYKINSNFEDCTIRISDESYYHAFDFSSPSFKVNNNFIIKAIDSDEEKGYSEGIEKKFLIKSK